MGRSNDIRTAGSALTEALSQVPGARIAEIVKEMKARDQNYAAVGNRIVIRYREGHGTVDLEGAKQMLERNLALGSSGVDELSAAIRQASEASR